MPTLNPCFILSESVPTMDGMHHPWRRLRERLPDWDVVLHQLPAGVLAGTDTANRRIWLDSRQLQAQRRCSLDHELIHAEAGDVGCQGPSREREIGQASARRLIPIAALVDAVKWAHDRAELADDLWVDLATLQCRLDHLHPAERAAVRRAIAERDFHEEGM